MNFNLKIKFELISVTYLKVNIYKEMVTLSHTSIMKPILCYQYVDFHFSEYKLQAI